MNKIITSALFDKYIVELAQEIEADTGVNPLLDWADVINRAIALRVCSTRTNTNKKEDDDSPVA